MTSPIRQTLADTTFRLANAHDAGPLADLFGQFFRESNYPTVGIEYDGNRAYEWLYGVLSSGVVPHILAEKDDQIVGTISYATDTTFSVKPVAVLHTFYVVPDQRRSALGRVLLGLAVDLAKGDGCCAFTAPVCSGLVDMKSLQNLLAKGGFGEAGYIMWRSL